MTIEDLLPMPPLEGPPLPRFLNIRWPWVAGCVELEPAIRYHFIYPGPRKTVKASLGECYDVIYYLEVYDLDTDDWWPPADPEHDLLEPKSKCAIRVQAPCRLCGFIRE